MVYGKWIKLSEELPLFNKLIVLLSERGFTELDVRETQNQIDEFNARMYSMSKKTWCNRYGSTNS